MRIRARHVLLITACVVVAVGLAVIAALWYRATTYDRLLAAIERGDVDTVRREIERGTDVNQPRDIVPDAIPSISTQPGTISGVTPLHEAAERPSVEIAELLLDAGADVNAAESYGWTPLIHATLFSSADMVRLLVERGADVNAAAPANWTPLHQAAFRRDPAKIRILLEAGAGLEAQDRSGMTPLMSAAREGGERAVDVLLEAGADVLAKDDEGRDVVQVAIHGGGPPEVVERLAEARRERRGG